MLLFVLSARQKAQHASTDFKTELKDLYKRKKPEGDGCHSVASLFGLFALIEINALPFLFTPGAMLDLITLTCKLKVIHVFKNPVTDWRIASVSVLYIWTQLFESR